jgi:predicted acetyltransferase
MRLVQPTWQWREAFLELARDCAEAGETRYRLALEDFAAYLSALSAAEHDPVAAGKRVPQLLFCLEDRGELVACLRLRTQLTAASLAEGGHIGYDVRPSRRGRGYGTRLLALGLIEARARGIARVRITCDADNLASVKVIERNGGVFSDAGISAESGALVNRYWIEPS